MTAEWYDRDGLPKFDHPPVIEAVLSIEFVPIPGLDNYRLSRLQGEWEAEYPSIAEGPGVPPSPADSVGLPMFNFRLEDGPRRFRAVSTDGTSLVQTQSDRLILNWVKVDEGTYPGYFDSLRTEFERLWGKLTNYLEEAGLPQPVPLLAEFDFVNAVPLAPEETLDKVVSVVRTPEEPLPGRDRFTRFHIIRDIPLSEDDPYTVQTQVIGEPQFKDDGSRQLVFTVVARAVLGAESANPVAGLDATHALASHTFARIVTREKIAEWGRSR